MTMTEAGKVVMALIYDNADTSTTPDAASLVQCEGNVRLPIWDASRRPVTYKPNLALLDWFVVSTSTGVAAENMENPATFQYVVSSTSPSIELGCFMCSYSGQVRNPVAVGMNS